MHLYQINLKIDLMGNEIKYYYEILDKASGNVDKVIDIFKKNCRDLII